LSASANNAPSTVPGSANTAKRKPIGASAVPCRRWVAAATSALGSITINDVPSAT